MPATKTSRFAAHEDKVITKRAERVARVETQCKLCRFLAREWRESPIDARHVQNMLEDRGRSASYIAAVMTEDGNPVADSSVKRHRLLHMSQ